MWETLTEMGRQYLKSERHMVLRWKSERNTVLRWNKVGMD